MYEKRSRSFMKAVSWRCWAIFLAAALAYLFSHNLKSSLYFSLIFNGINSVLFYVHERAWNRISYGRISHQGQESQGEVIDD